MNRLISLSYDINKYLNYFFESKGFTVDSQAGVISDSVLQAAASARGYERGPALIIHGIMPRSGTVYVGELLRRHPDLYAYPHQLWELPALLLTADLRRLQRKFLLSYKSNMGKLEKNDFLPLFGAAMMALLNVQTPPMQRVLTKMPSVQYLDHFFSMFPNENVLILVRDGRDVVHSTLRTWSHLNFIQVCLRWKRSAQIILNTREQFRSRDHKGYWVGRYEDALLEPEIFVREVCCQFQLSVDRYPFEEIDKIRVIGSSKLESQDKVTWQHLKRPQNFRPVEYWKNWSPLKKKIFKVIAGQPLMDLGYCQDQNW
jgi:protein-tyrosine sulfotransferase